MHVLATAGHVDHGKSTLVHALTGMRPDRLAEEQRRGLTIELGYAWTDLPAAGAVAFVDVPGHERFVTTMLAGVGPVPAVLLVVAADEGWKPQTAEHVAALHSLRVRHGLLAVTRGDLADPAPVVRDCLDRLAPTTLAGLRCCPVSARTGDGIRALRTALGDVVRGLPPVAAGGDPRLWVDRVFGVAGAGTVVTGTLTSGRVAVGDRLSNGDAEVVVRGLQSLGREVDAVQALARVAVRLGGRLQDGPPKRGAALVGPGAFVHTDVVDVRAEPADRCADRCADRWADRWADRAHLHVGSADVTCRVRRLGDDIVRLQLARPLPLRVGDRCLLREPGSRRVRGCTVLDPAPPALRRRGAAARRASSLAATTETPDLDDELRRRGVVERRLLARVGVPVEAAVAAAGDTVEGSGGWLASADRAASCRRRLADVVRDHQRAYPLEPGPALPRAARLLDLPPPLVRDLLVRPPLALEGGRVVSRATRDRLPDPVRLAVQLVVSDLAGTPFRAPPAERLDELGLTTAALAAADRVGALLRIDDRVVLAPGADDEAAAVLARQPQPLSVSEAGRALGSSRRVVLPLLRLLERQGRARMLADDRRVVHARRAGDG